MTRPSQGLGARPGNRVVAFATLIAFGLAACSTNDGRNHLPPAKPDQTLSIVETTTTEVPADFSIAGPWGEGDAIDPAYTCKGANQSPALTWGGVPDGAVELAIVMRDDDAAGFLHWVVTGITSDITSIEAGAIPDGATVAVNDFGDPAYGGPCPPSGTHTYSITLYALRDSITVGDNPVGIDVVSRLKSFSIGTVVLNGTFSS